MSRTNTEPAAAPSPVIQATAVSVVPPTRPVQAASTRSSLFTGENSFDYTAEDLEMLDMAGVDDESLGGALVPLEEENEGVVDVDGTSYTGVPVIDERGKQAANEPQAQQQQPRAATEAVRSMSSGTGTAAGRKDRSKQIEEALRSAAEEEERASASPDGSPTDAVPQESVQRAVLEPQQQRFQPQGAAARTAGAADVLMTEQQQRTIPSGGEFNFPPGMVVRTPQGQTPVFGGSGVGIKRNAESMSGATSGFSNTTRRPAQGMGLAYQPPQRSNLGGAGATFDGNDPKRLRR
jgi:hypothetical protein